MSPLLVISEKIATLSWLVLLLLSLSISQAQTLDLFFSDFADFVFKRYEEQELTNGIQKIASESQTFDFLNNEEEIYSIADLKEVYNG